MTKRRDEPSIEEEPQGSEAPGAPPDPAPLPGASTGPDGAPVKPGALVDSLRGKVAEVKDVKKEEGVPDDSSKEERPAPEVKSAGILGWQAVAVAIILAILAIVGVYGYRRGIFRRAKSSAGDTGQGDPSEPGAE